MKLSDLTQGQFFVTGLGNTCQKINNTTITRLFNSFGQACVHLFGNRDPNEQVIALPIGTNF